MTTFAKNTVPALPVDQQVAGFNASTRQVEEFARAKRHSGLVRLLKFVLPAIAILIVLAIIAALVWRSLSAPTIDVGAISVEDGKLVMQNPHLNGYDGNNRPFSLVATRASQNVENPSIVELLSISAKLPIDDDIFATITAGIGIYDAEAKTLALSEKVRVITNNGMQLELEDAYMDIGNGMLKTKNPIFAKSKEAQISARSLLVENNGERLVFEDRVIMILNPVELRELNNAKN